MLGKSTVALALLAQAVAQQPGTLQEESHPALTIETCSASGCTTATKSITLDANWRWLESGGSNCFTGNEWDDTLCPDPVTCAATCSLEGVSEDDYEATYGISTTGSEMSIKFVTEGTYATNVGSRSYLMASEDKYEMFYLKNREFSVDVDVSTLPCGLNGALYMISMSEDGGLSAYEGNNAGAKYGTGYCDAQCPHDIKFINGESNTLDWTPSPVDVNSGTGHYGSCCFEMDIWEANSISQAYTPHVCSISGQTRCEDTDCGDTDSNERYDGVCDKDGCDFATYRQGNTTFFGPGSDFVVDTASPFTVVTQFITANNTDEGDLIEIRRFYVQDGVVIENPTTSVGGTGFDSLTDDFCTTQKETFGDEDLFGTKGGLKAMGDELDNGMVLALSLWDDYTARMLWLDSDYPTDADPTSPGVARGTCDTTSGDPTDVEANSPDATVKFSNIKVGTIGSTF